MSDPSAEPNSYAAPKASEAVADLSLSREWRAASKAALRAFGVGLGVTVFAFMIRAGPLLFIVATLAFTLGVVRAVVALVRMSRAGEMTMGWWPAGVALFPLLSGAVMAFLGGVLTLMSIFGRGRQLRGHGRILLPKLAPTANWATDSMTPTAPEHLREQLAARWRWNGRTEHASVAAFAQHTLDLVALGAPPALVEAANADGRDEIRHAELCFALARGLDGRVQGPAPFPEARSIRRIRAGRTLDLAQLAVSSLIDGALHEGISARVLARLVRTCTDPATRDVLKTLAADEGRHAAHAWDVVEWCVAEGGLPVLQALRGAIAALPDHLDDELPDGARDGSWEPFGVPGVALESEEHAAALAHLTGRVMRLGGRFANA